MDCFDQAHTKRLNILDCYFDIRISELDFENPFFKKLRKGKVKDQEVDSDYAWLFNPVNQTTQPEKDTIRKHKNEHRNKNETEDEDEDEDEHEDEHEDEDEHEGEGVNIDENNKDPEYLQFLENLTEDGKSYKLKISNNDEEPVFVSYEEARQVCTDDSGDNVTVSEDTPIKPKAKRKANEMNGGNEIRSNKEASRRNKPKDHKPSANNSPCVKVKIEEESFENEDIVTTSDSEVVILDNVQNWSEVKDKQSTKNEPSLKEKLMKILKVPYSEKEYKELSDYIEQEKPVLQLKPLREGRFRSNAKAGFNKTVLSHAPHRFRSMLKAAQNDPPKAINLLRMFRFWLEHVPNVDAFQPWTDEDILKVRPRVRRMI